MEIDDDLVYRTDENGEPLIKHKGKWYKSSDFKSFDLGEYIDKRIEKYLKDKENKMSKTIKEKRNEDYPHVFSVSEPKIIYRSKIHVSKVLTIMSDKHYNWFQRFMWKAFFNVKVENINTEEK